MEGLVSQLLLELPALGYIPGGDHDPPDVRVVEQIVDGVFEVAPGAVPVRDTEL
jgi:hypothetical protein